jgi:hypothetical protein
MLCVIVVPRYVVILQEREKFFPVSLEARFTLACDFTSTLHLREFPVETIDFHFVLFEKSLL